MQVNGLFILYFTAVDMTHSALRVLLFLVIFRQYDSICYKDLYNVPGTFNDDVIDKLFPGLFQTIDPACVGHHVSIPHGTRPELKMDAVRYVCPGDQEVSQLTVHFMV